MTPKKMTAKILIIGSIPPPHHGANNYNLWLLQSRLQQEFQILHLDTSDHRDLNNLTKLDVINVFLAIKQVLQLVWMVLAKGPDIVYVVPSASALPYLRDGLFLLVARYFSHARIVIHMHTGMNFRTDFYEGSPWFVRAFVRWTLGCVDTAIVLADRLHSIFEGLVSNVVTVHNGIDIPLFERQKKQADPGLLTVTYMSGSLVKEKGLFDVLECAEEVCRKYSHVRFKIAGPWVEPSTERLAHRFIQEHGLGNRVEFVGLVVDKAKQSLLDSSDIFLFPSWYEGFGLVNLEAMAVGIPVISSAGIGAIPEVVVDGETGLLVEPRRPDLLAVAVSRLIDSPELRLLMGNAGRARLEERFSFEKNIDGMISVFRHVLRGE